jgi:hypothetical protein
LQQVTNCHIAVISLARHKQPVKNYAGWADISTALIQRTMGKFVNQQPMIYYHAGKHYDHFVSAYPRFVQTVPLQYVASCLGIAQPSLSRIRKQAAKKRFENGINKVHSPDARFSFRFLHRPLQYPNPLFQFF